MNSREKILASMVMICLVTISALLVSYYNLNNGYTLAVETTSEFMSILEIEGSNVPKIFVGEKFLFGGSLSLSNWSNSSRQRGYLEKYSSHIQEVIAIIKFQVYLLGEDPELFEQCLFEIHDFQQSIQSGEESCMPYVAWKGKFRDCPIAIHTPEEPSKYDDIEVWAIMILFNDWLGMETTYYINSETQERLPFVMTTN